MTSPDGALPAATRLRASPTVKRLGRLIETAWSELLLLLALLLLVTWGSVSIANSLPGIRPFEDLPGLGSAVLLAVPVLLVAAIVVEWGAFRSGRFVHELARACGRVQARARVLLVVHLGLVVPRRRLAGVLGAGVAAGVLSTGAIFGLTAIPWLASTAAPDARYAAVAEAPEWAEALYLAVYAPAWEEILYRGSLLLVVATIYWWTTRADLRRPLVAVSLVVASVLFGLTHLGWSLLNAATATISGLLWGGAAITTRSLWPAVIAHSLSNFLIGVSWALR